MIYSGGRRVSRYHQLSNAQKQAAAREAMREPALSCPRCETMTSPGDLLRHVATSCPGRREPHPRCRWVSWSEAMAMGVARVTLRRWVSNRWVRRRRAEGRWEYLLRDLVWHLALRRGARGST